jgi:hypothetical protein
MSARAIGLRLFRRLASICFPIGRKMILLGIASGAAPRLCVCCRVVILCGSV